MQNLFPQTEFITSVFLKASDTFYYTIYRHKCKIYTTCLIYSEQAKQILQPK